MVEQQKLEREQTYQAHIVVLDERLQILNRLHEISNKKELTAKDFDEMRDLIRKL